MEFMNNYFMFCFMEMLPIFRVYIGEIELQINAKI